MNLLSTILLYFLSLYTSATISLLAMGQLLALPLLSSLGLLLASVASLLLCAVFGIAASLLLRLFGKQRLAQHLTSRAFAHTMALTTSVHFDVVAGAAHLATRPAVLIGNHQTELDVLLLASVWPRWCSVTAKKSLRRVPVLGWFMALSGTVFLDRANRGEARRAFEHAAMEITTARQSVFIFPEGTRSYAQGPTMLPFKKGAFHLAVQAGVPIVPVVCANYWGVMGMKEWRFRRGRIPVVVLPPIPTHNIEASDVDRLCEHTRTIMLEALIKLTESPLGQQAALPVPPPLLDRNSAIEAVQQLTTGAAEWKKEL